MRARFFSINAIIKLKIILAFFVVILIGSPTITLGATISTSPVNLTVVSGETFNLSIFLDTENEEINTLDIIVRFPPDKLQVASTQTGNSLISLWTSQPNFDNINGTVRLQGGIPNGINTSKGLVTTLSFRARSVGTASIRIDSDSKAFINDGQGTLSRLTTGSSLIKIVLPPPAGPSVTLTGQEIGNWSTNNNPSISWSIPDGNQNTTYSYILDRKPTTIPDNIPDSSENTVVYENLEDGEFYFHIKAFNNGAWGGVTHIPIRIDNTPPAKFPINFIPSNRTSSTQPVINLQTTDNFSGLRNYEMAIVSIDQNNGASQPFFFEFTSPYVLPEMLPGAYEIIVRAYDNAGNFQEVSERLVIVRGFISVIGTEGLVIRNLVTIPWWIIWSLLILIIAGLSISIYRLKHLNRVCEIDNDKLKPNIQEKIKELEQYRLKYQQAKKELSRLAVILLILGTGFFANQQIALADPLTPPIVINYSSKIAEDEIFYLSGKAQQPESSITIYFQDSLTGELRTFETVTDKNGGFIYQNPGFIKSGNYIFWTQLSQGEISSPPSPQYKLEVKKSAIDFGFSRFSYELVFSVITLILVLVIIIAILYFIRLRKLYRQKIKRLQKEGQEAENELRSGFKEIKLEIHRELENIRRQVKCGTMTPEIAEQEEEKILQDLEVIEAKIEKEIEDILKSA